MTLMDHSEPAPTTTVRTTRIFDLPHEILLVVIAMVDIPNILNIRQTCRTFLDMTFERSIWIAKLQEQETYLPMPPNLRQDYHHENGYFHGYSTSDIESLVINASRSSGAWDKPRMIPYKLKRESLGTTLMELKMIFDRWLLAFYFEGAIYLYDTQPTHYSGYPFDMSRDSGYTKGVTDCPVVRAALFLETGLWTSCASSINKSGGLLTLALSRSVPPHMLQIYEIDLASLASGSLFLPDAFRFIKQIPLQAYKSVKALYPPAQLVAVSTPGLVELIKWNNTSQETKKTDRMTIEINPEDLEGLWNGVIAVHFMMESYLLIFKTRSLEIHKQSSCIGPSINSHDTPFKHTFSMTFRDVSFSQCIVSRNTFLETETYETTLFAYDVIQGLFHYTVRITTPTSLVSDLSPRFEVILTDVYPLAVGLTSTSLLIPLSSRRPAHSTLLSSSVTYSANFTPAYNNPTVPIQGSQQPDASSRGFLSAHSMGSQGKRAIWVERKRSSTVREVLVWNRDHRSSTAKEKEVHDGVMAPMEIERRPIFSVNSYDLRDDITCCTFSELNGTIALGHRSGDISILEPNYSR